MTRKYTEIIIFISFLLGIASPAGANVLHMHVDHVCVGTIKISEKNARYKGKPVRVVITQTTFMDGRTEKEELIFYQNAAQNFAYATKIVPMNHSLLRLNADGSGFLTSGKEKTYFKVRPIRLAAKNIIGLDVWLQKKPSVGDTFIQKGVNFGDRVMSEFRYEITSITPSDIKGDIYSLSTKIGEFKTDENGQMVFQKLFGIDFIRSNQVNCDKETYLAQKEDDRICILFNRPLSQPNRLAGIQFYMAKEVSVPSSRFVKVEKKENKVRVQIRAPRPFRVTSENLSLFIKKDRSHPVYKKEIQQFVKKNISSTETDEKEIVNRLFRSVSNQIENSDQQLSVLEGLQQQKGDCVTKAEIFASACREKKIPTRVVYGLVINSDPQIGFLPHAWNEIYIHNRWYNVDTTRPFEKADARYLPLGYDKVPIEAKLLVWGKQNAVLVEEVYIP